MAPPILLLTRPLESAHAFAASLDPAALAGVRVVIAPLMGIVGTGASIDLTGVHGVIFTSANGVMHAPDGAGRRAYCVGAKTTQSALARGWRAQQRGDTARELVYSLQSDLPDAPLLHLAGEHTRGDIASRLTAAGIRTDHISLYAQTLLSLEPQALAALDGGPCIVPVFSPRSAAHLVREATGHLAQAHVVALSDAVATPFCQENIARMVELPAPQTIYMRKAVENLCRTLCLP
tara:strand:+ start:64391 stop:65095 length:705 start_codon:yes stop_codon:yes gene_type:complete